MSLRVIWCWLLLLVFPPNVLDAQSQSAMVMVSGVAALNGTAMAASTTIFAGDLLETGLGSLTVNAKGTTIRIGANSRVRYFGNSIELQLGSTQVNTSKDMIVETETIKVGPNKISAMFRVDRALRAIVISALEEEVRVDNNGDSKVLLPGTNVTLVEQDQGQPPSPVGGPSNKKLFVYAAIGTGTGAAILILENDKKRPCNNQISEFKFCD